MHVSKSVYTMFIIHCHSYSTDPYEDQFEKQSADKKERIAKNEYQRLKNIAKNTKGGRVKGGQPHPSLV